MNGKLAGGLWGLLLGSLLGSAYGQESSWQRGFGTASAPANPPSASSPRSAIALDRPQPMMRALIPQPFADPRFAPASYMAGSLPAPIIRAASGDEPKRIPTANGLDHVTALKPQQDDSILQTPAPPPNDKPPQPEVLPRPQRARKPEPRLEPEPITPPAPMPPAGSTWEGSCGNECDGNCCPSGPSCCPSGPICCPSGPICCPSGPTCCPSGPTCCPSICCPSDTTCCPSGPCCGPCDARTCGDWWIRGEYLLWNVRRGPAPPLVTTSPASSGGVLGAPGTTVLFGGPLDYEEQNGGRFTLGYWFDCCKNYGIEGSFFFLGQRSADFTSTSGGDPLLARPFFAVNTGASAAELVASPGLLSGTVIVNSPSKLWGADVDGIFNVGHRGFFDWGLLGCGRMDFLAGFRYLQLEESLTIDEALVAPPGAPNAGLGFTVEDRFATRNQFYGGQLGLRREWDWGHWSLDVTGKVALGVTHESVDITGATTITPPGGTPRTFVGGLLAQPTNIGSYSHDTFSVVPEIGLNVGYQVTSHIRAFVGYDFLYWSKVARPGDQIDLGVNTTQVPRFTGGAGTLVGPARPAFAFRESDFWAQGVNFGLEFRF